MRMSFLDLDFEIMQVMKYWIPAILSLYILAQSM